MTGARRSGTVPIELGGQSAAAPLFDVCDVMGHGEATGLKLLHVPASQDQPVAALIKALSL